jgi:hypothetical protein
VDCDPNTEGDQDFGTVGAGASVDCTYAANLDSNTDGTNTATVTSNTASVGDPVGPVEAGYAFGDPILT